MTVQELHEILAQWIDNGLAEAPVCVRTWTADSEGPGGSYSLEPLRAVDHEPYAGLILKS